MSWKFNKYKNKISYINISCHSKTLSVKTGTHSFYLRSININVIPSFGRIVNVIDNEKDVRVYFRLIFSSEKSKPPEPDSEPSDKNPLTLIPPDTFHSAPGKSSKNPSTNSKSMNTSKGPDFHEDSDSDLNTLFYINSLLF